MAVHGVLHLNTEIDRVYISREMGRKKLISCEGCMRMKESKLGWYIRNSFELLIEEGKLQKQ